MASKWSRKTFASRHGFKLDRHDDYESIATRALWNSAEFHNRKGSERETLLGGSGAVPFSRKCIQEYRRPLQRSIAEQLD
jgi:hypothetical protein